MDLGLEGRAYVVTGGSSGLGRATAEVLVAEGASVVLVGRTASTLAAAAAELGDRAATVTGDLADAATIGVAIVTCQERFGTIDGGFVSYGGPPPGDAGDMDDDRLTASVARGLVEPARAARELVRASGDDGSVLVLASSSVEQPIPGLAGSNLTRPGLWGYVSTLADEVAPTGRRVNVLIPGRFATGRLDEVHQSRADSSGRTFDEERADDAAAIPARRIGDPQELGRVAAFLLSPAASYVTGAAWRVDGGLIRGL